MRIYRMRIAMSFLFVSLTLAAQVSVPPPQILPAVATEQLHRSLEAAKPRRTQLWRDTPPFNDDGTVNGYIEIPREDKRKYEFHMGDTNFTNPASSRKSRVGAQRKKAGRSSRRRTRSSVSAPR